MATHLSSELVTVIHHVELSKAGWQDKTTQRLIVSVLWLSSGPMTRVDLRKAMETDFSLIVSDESMTKHLDALAEAGQVLQMPDKKLKLLESYRSTLDIQLSECEATENKVRDRYSEVFAKQAPLLSSIPSWDTFKSKVYMPMLQEIGARAYELLSGDRSRFRDSSALAAFVNVAPERERAALRTAILEFLDPHDASLRAHILRHVHAFMCLDAEHLSAKTIESLVKAAGIKKTLRLLIDTNFLFSLLGLHDNPSNEAAHSLMALLKEATQYIDVRLFVLPQTLDEAKRVLLAHKQIIREYRANPSMPQVAIQQEISGITKRYFEFASSHTLVSPDEYFSPYLSSLPTIVREHGIEVFGETLDAYRTKAEVMDDINEQLAHETALQQDPQRKHRPKHYESLQHDITLWHFAMDQQRQKTGQGGFMIVTIDYRFLAFDRFKRRTLPGSVPAVVHPAPLVQSLSFYVPRTPQFEKAVVDSIRLPFLFQPFDPEAEKVSLKIIARLSQFENIGSFSPTALANIVINSTLREKFATEHSIEDEVRLIENALAEEHMKVTKELAAQRDQTKQQKRAIDGLSKHIESKEVALALERQERQSLSQADAAKAARIAELEKALCAKDAQITEELIRRRFKFNVVGVPVTCIMIVAAAGGVAWSHIITKPMWVLQGSIAVCLAVPWLYIANRVGRRHEAVCRSRFYRILKKSWLLIAAVLLAVLGNLIYDLVKAQFGW